jgi:predicted nucleic acid-binding protein
LTWVPRALKRRVLPRALLGFAFDQAAIVNRQDGKEHVGGLCRHRRIDPDDDPVLACALAAAAELIVSGDAHLLNLKHYHGIQVVGPHEASARIGIYR